MFVVKSCWRTSRFFAVVVDRYLEKVWSLWLNPPMDQLQYHRMLHPTQPQDLKPFWNTGSKKERKGKSFPLAKCRTRKRKRGKCSWKSV
uniref:Uncharacterized protein n=1 Tax=Gasterosteus aculeatus TaxID=69293 RepID=G3N4R7_GASAC